MDILLVGGNFDDNGGRASKIVDTVYATLSNNVDVSAKSYGEVIKKLTNELINRLRKNGMQQLRT